MLFKIKVLKVAHKVILGFAIILLLLLFSSISSVGILSDIEQASAKVDDFALPI
jgi:methyl-accepting chemotaxis protein